MAMTLSKATIEVLKNFSTINPSILFTQGNKLMTKSIVGEIGGFIDIEETIEGEFAIYKLNEFLSVLSLFSKPSLELDDTFLTIKEEGAKRGGIKYFFCDKTMIKYPNRCPEINNISVSFIVSEENLSKIQKVGNTLGLEDVSIVGNSEGIFLVIRDIKQKTKNDFEVVISEEPQEIDFMYNMKLENLKFLPGNYRVDVFHDNKATAWQSDCGRRKYIVSLQSQK